MKKFRSIVALILALSMVAVLFCGCGETEPTATPTQGDGEWVPTKDINFVVPYEVGGNSDIPARVFAKYMSKYSATTVSVSNITGAGGRTGALEVQKADADGYTVVMQPVAYPMQYSLGIATFSYTDFEMVGRWLDSCLAVVVNANSPYNTLQDLIDAAKANPNTIKMGSKTQTLPLFAIMDLESRSGAKFLKVDLDQKAPELLSNRIDAYIDGFGAIKSYVDSKQFKCLAVISTTDVPGYESLSTYKELGYKDYEYLMQSFGMWAPKGTPKAAVEYINNLIKQAAADPECVKELATLGYTPTWMSVSDYTKAMETTYKTFAESAKAILG